MKLYWDKEEVLRVLGYYDLSGEVYRDLLSLDTYDEIPNSVPTTNINFFCGKDKVEDIIEKIAKNNDGKISIVKGD